MVENSPSDTDVLVFEDLNECNEKLTVELEKYSYECVVLGLDCEWVTKERQEDAPVCPVALLQLAFPNGKCFLIRLCRMNANLPDKLKEILEDRCCLKVGVGIGEDAKKLNCSYGLVVQGCIDLRHVALRCRRYVQHCLEGETRDSMSLSALSQQILGITLDKDWKIRCSNWEAENLSERQVHYAANDAIVAVKIFFMLAASKLKEKEERCEAGGIKTVGNSSNSDTIPLQTGADSVPSDSENQEDSSCLGEDEVQLVDKHVTEAGKGTMLDVENTPERTNISEGGVLSGLLSKLGSFSLDSIFPRKQESIGMQDHRSKIYAQYSSFKSLEMTEELLAFDELWHCLAPLCQGIVDVPFKGKMKQKNKGAGGEKAKQGGSSSQGRNKISGLKPRRAPLYQNCVLEAPDGEMLSTCDKRKAEWYLCRDLADVVKEDPYTIRLRFEPSGRPLDPENNYYLTFKENMCVVCGRNDNYMRKNIIPHDYRKHFPVCMKDHHSHDVLLLCPPCHMISTHHDDMLRRRLADKYGAPLASAQVARLVQDPILKKAKCAAKALVYAGDQIPEKRREELLSVVKKFLGDENPTREMLVSAADMETRRENCDFISHGKEVVQKVKESGELLSFERMWREHFLETMKPQFLPPLWTVDHEQEKVKRLLEQEDSSA